MTHGERFARAVAAKDRAALLGLLADRLDFGGLTPGRHWQASSGGQAVDEIILAHWFGPDDHVERLCSVSTGRVGDRDHVAYRFLVRNPDGEFLVEQQAYYATESDRITWLRILCSGYRRQEPSDVPTA